MILGIIGTIAGGNLQLFFVLYLISPHNIISDSS